MANCNVTDSAGTSALSAPVFCDNLAANCAGLPSTYNSTNCTSTYGALSTAAQHCQSYHLCWGVEGKSATAPIPRPTVRMPKAEAPAPVCNRALHTRLKRRPSREGQAPFFFSSVPADLN